MTRARSIPIRDGDSAQGPKLTVIDNPQARNLWTTAALSPLQRAHSQMVAELSLLAPLIPQPSSVPDADEIREFEPHMVKVAEAVDRYFAVVGQVLSSHVLGVDLDVFDLPCLKAIEGNALHECQSAVEAVEEGTDIRTGMWAAE